MRSRNRWPRRPSARRSRASPTAPATPDDLATCAGIWRDSINDYLGRLEPARDPRRPRRDPAALRPPPGDRPGDVPRRRAGDRRRTAGGRRVHRRRTGARTCGSSRCCSCCRRSRRWGLGRALLAKVMPPAPAEAGARATATDSVQPISNGLYASLGIVPRMPLVRLVGLVQRDGHMPDLPRGVSAVPFRDRRRRGGRPPGRRADRDRPGDGGLRASRGSRLRPGRGPDRRPLRRRRRPGRRLRLRVGGGPGRADRGSRRGAARPGRSASCSGRSRPAARSGSGCRARRARRCVPLLRAGFRVDGFPCPALLGPAVRRLLALRADLARPAVAPTPAAASAAESLRSGVLLWGLCPFRAAGSLWRDVAPASCPRTEPR